MEQGRDSPKVEPASWEPYPAPMSGESTSAIRWAPGLRTRARPEKEGEGSSAKRWASLLARQGATAGGWQGAQEW